MRGRSRTVGWLAIGAAVTGAVVVAGRRRRDSAPTAERTVIAEADQRYTCECGAAYGVSGAGRHRVFWPADGEPADAVLEDHCPACNRPWPAEETLTTA
jgi:hypothetical protein